MAITVLNNDKQQVRIWLAEIDAPEAGQTCGITSKQSLSELCFGKRAQIKPWANDKHGRTVESGKTWIVERAPMKELQV